MAARFNDYREITAKFDSTATSCGSREPEGHKIRKGDRIGYAPRSKETHCADCWQRWCAENAEADLYEANNCF